MTTEPEELPVDLHEAIRAACERGDELVDAGRFDEALAIYDEALQLIPEPRTKWEVSTFVLAAIGDTCFQAGYGASAIDALELVMHCPDAIGNPFIHLRYGQVLHDEGQPDRAADELMRAFMGGGYEIFDDEDGKYLAFLATRAKLPPRS